ncbi:MAG TPA: hypothetical protein VIK57_18085 [Streptosporangiaceae bacterium]
MPVAYPARLSSGPAPHIAQWRPLVQWLLGIPQLLIASTLRSVRQVLILISLFTERIPRPVFDIIASGGRSR